MEDADTRPLRSTNEPGARARIPSGDSLASESTETRMNNSRLPGNKRVQVGAGGKETPGPLRNKRQSEFTFDSFLPASEIAEHERNDAEDNRDGVESAVGGLEGLCQALSNVTIEPNKPRRASVATVKAMSMAAEMAKSDKEQRLVNAESFKSSGSAKAEQLVDLEFQMHVDGWEFVSEHALAQEYVSNAADVVSIV